MKNLIGMQVTNINKWLGMQVPRKPVIHRCPTNKKYGCRCSTLGEEGYVNTPQIIRSCGNDSDSKNKSFNNVHGLLKQTSNNTRKCEHSATSITWQRDKTSPLQMSQEILHQLGDEMGINVDESKNINLRFFTQLMHSFLHAYPEMLSWNKASCSYTFESPTQLWTLFPHLGIPPPL